MWLWPHCDFSSHPRHCTICAMAGVLAYTMVGMLPTSRVFAVLVLGLGCVLLGAGLVLPKLVEVDRPLPLDVDHTQLTLSDSAATIGKAYVAGARAEDPDVITGPVSRTAAVTFGAPADEEAAAVTVGLSTMRDDMVASLGEDAGLLDAEVWSVRVDRKNGAVLNGPSSDNGGSRDTKVADTLGSPSTPATVDGQWLAFPRKPSQSEAYPYFDTLLRRSIPATFDHAVDEGGREVYVFRQEMIAEPVLTANPRYARLTQNVITQGEGGRPGTASVSTLHRSGSREITVEPTSGLIVAVKEDLHDYYAGEDGVETGLLLDFHGDTPDGQRDALLTQAVKVGEGRPVGTWALALTLIGAIVTVVAGVVALKPQKSGGESRGEQRKTSKRKPRKKRSRKPSV